MMNRLAMGAATIGFALVLTASPALAFQCPKLIQQVSDVSGNRFDAGAAAARALAAEADALHKANKHADAVAKAEEAAKAIGLALKK